MKYLLIAIGVGSAMFWMIMYSGPYRFLIELERAQLNGWSRRSETI